MVPLATVTYKSVTTKTNIDLATTCIFHIGKDEIREFRHLRENTSTEKIAKNLSKTEWNELRNEIDLAELKTEPSRRTHDSGMYFTITTLPILRLHLKQCLRTLDLDIFFWL